MKNNEIKDYCKKWNHCLQSFSFIVYILIAWFVSLFSTALFFFTTIPSFIKKKHQFLIDELIINAKTVMY